MPDWSTLAEIGTALALPISAVLLFLTLRDRRRDNKARRRAQAEHISAWADDRYVREGDSGRLVRRSYAHLRNTGTQPVYEVSAVLGYGFLPKSVRSIGTLGHTVASACPAA